MTTMLAVFICSLILSLLFTPLAARLGYGLGMTDAPKARKVHSRIMPRSGGLAIFSSLALTLALASALNTDLSRQLAFDRQMWCFILGGLLVFGVGVIDDRFQVPARIKLLVQIGAALTAFAGGLRIEILTLNGFINLNFDLLVSLGLTVFWFVFIINAINLIDGLDGLAAGVVFFVSMVQVILSSFRQDYLMAMLFAALAGSTLGFLRYNFNPASIFLGDGGSYLLGYVVAGLSLRGSVKSEVGAALLIPIIALGVPLFDTILSPLRRFMLGKGVFQPDDGHIHHQLLKRGWTQRQAVVLLYGVTVLLGVAALVLVNLRDERSGLFLVILGVVAVILVRKLGYFNYIALDTVYGWVRDISDAAGISRDRRSFLSVQVDITASGDMNAVWESISAALDKLNFDLAEMNVRPAPPETCTVTPSSVPSPVAAFAWSRPGFDRDADLCRDSLFKLELPLLDENGRNWGTLWLVKDLERDPISHYTLRRIEHLRRTVMAKLADMAEGKDKKS